MNTMKAVRFYEYGAPEVLTLEYDVPVPVPGDDDVLVRVHAAAVNPLDCKVRQGRLHAMIQHKLPLIPGWDFSGVVEGTGAEVFGKADVARDGAYAELIAVRRAEVAEKPPTIDHVHAAAVPTAALTAWQSLFGEDGHPSLGLRRGQTLLIQGGAGGVGSFAVQLAHMVGARVVVTARKDNERYLRDLGADETIDYENELFEDRIKYVDAVLDLVGGDIQDRSWGVLRPGGSLASTVHPPSEQMAKRYDVRPVTVGAHMTKEHLEEISRLIDDGLLHVPVTEVMPLEQARRAHEISESGHARGKLVLKVTA